MPKSTKAPPPQQASLQEMWRKKKIKPKAESEEMAVDLMQAQIGIMSMTPARRVFISPTAEPSKRKSPTPPSRMLSLESTWHDFNLKMCSISKDQKA